MKIRSTACRLKKTAVLLSALLLLAPLTGCANKPVIVNDPSNACDHPKKPDKPYTDKKVAILITKQSESIDKCRALLGH